MEPLINKILPYTQLHLQYENFEMNAHRHHTIELLYIIRGTMSVIFEDEKLQTECVLKSNQFLLILPQYKHRYSIKSHTEINILELGHANPQIPFIKWLLSGDYADRFAFTEKLRNNRCYSTIRKTYTRRLKDLFCSPISMNTTFPTNISTANTK